MNIRYDNALSAIVQAILSAGGERLIAERKIGFLRDAAGVITVIHINSDHDVDIEPIRKVILGVDAYIDPSYVVALPSELMDEALSDEGSYQVVSVKLASGENISVLILNRRMVGADWLSSVRDAVHGNVPIFAFCSLKGGVGRSTALSVAASDLSQNGLRVLAIDLDLEAPGLGSMLLPVEYRPKFGTLDYYVERGPSAFDDEDFAMMMEPSPYFEGGAPVYVAPAFGMATLSNPENVLGKLSLAYVDDIDEAGIPIGFLERTRALIEGFLKVRAFDVILVDSRAGLHETSAASMLGIGADVLLFGTYQPQTFEGYLPLLAHITENVVNSAKLLPRLRMVHAKADLTDEDEIALFRDATHSMFTKTLYGKPEQSIDDFEKGSTGWFNISDSDGPHYPWLISENTKFRLFDPGSKGNQLELSVISEVFSDFIGNLRQSVLDRLEDTSGA